MGTWTPVCWGRLNDAVFESLRVPSNFANVQTAKDRVFESLRVPSHFANVQTAKDRVFESLMVPSNFANVQTANPTKQGKIGKLLLGFCMGIPPLLKVKEFKVIFLRKNVGIATLPSALLNQK